MLCKPKIGLAEETLHVNYRHDKLVILAGERKQVFKGK